MSDPKKQVDDPFPPGPAPVWYAKVAPIFIWWRFWLPALGLAIASGVAAYAIILFTGKMGVALFVAVPVGVGSILGFGIRTRPLATLVLGAAAALGLGIAVITMNLAGLFCGFTLVAVFILPMLAGIVLGRLLGAVLKRTSWDQRTFLPLVLLALLPLGVEVIENRFPNETVVAVVETELTIDATPQQVWNSLMYYEQVEHEPPWLLKLALPRPVRTQGKMAAVGDVQTCIYRRGKIVKQITRRVEPELLAFNVIEQDIHFEHDVRLIDGSFRMEPIGPGKTRVVLTTRYERLLSPAWLWEPTERKVVHTLHEHVLEGIRRKAE